MKAIVNNWHNVSMGLAIILVALGLSGFIFHMGRVTIQIVSNNLFNIYGASTIYGSNISIAAEE